MPGSVVTSLTASIPRLFLENLVKRQAKQPRVFSPVITTFISQLDSFFFFFFFWRDVIKETQASCRGRDGDSEKEENERNKSLSLAGSWPRFAITIDTLLASAVRSKKVMK